MMSIHNRVKPLLQTTVRFTEEFNELLRIEMARRRIRTLQQAIEEALSDWMKRNPAPKMEGLSPQDQEWVNKFLAFRQTASRDKNEIVEMIISSELSARVAGRQSAPSKKA
jgi:phage regulator Rha-like protein